MLVHGNCSLAEAKELDATSMKNNRYRCDAFTVPKQNYSVLITMVIDVVTNPQAINPAQLI
jgi:hypothetical protein